MSPLVIGPKRATRYRNTLECGLANRPVFVIEHENALAAPQGTLTRVCSISRSFGYLVRPMRWQGGPKRLHAYDLKDLRSFIGSSEQEPSRRTTRCHSARQGPVPSLSDGRPRFSELPPKIAAGAVLMAQRSGTDRPRAGSADRLDAFGCSENREGAPGPSSNNRFL